jgi:hypothetical protein
MTLIISIVILAVLLSIAAILGCRFIDWIWRVARYTSSILKGKLDNIL